MADPIDRRASERMAVGQRTVCPAVGRIIEDVGPVKVRDISLTGIGLVLLRPVEAGTALAITLSNSDQNITKTTVVRVMHTTPVHGGHLVGCVFTEPLTYQELTAFVR